MKDRKSILVFADVHGNYNALKCVLRELGKGVSDGAVCLGDVVGYGPEPVRCCEALEELRDVILLKGNHDAMLCGEESGEGCSGIGRRSAIWTGAVCGQEIKDHISRYPDVYRIGADCGNTGVCQPGLSGRPGHSEQEVSGCGGWQAGMLFCHSIRGKSGEWLYLNDAESIRDAFADVPERIVCYGHTHRMRLTVVDDAGDILEDRLIAKSEDVRISPESGRRYYINVGSVGQQRDTRTDCGYVKITRTGGGLILSFVRKRYRTLPVYRKIVRYGCGRETADYFIREKWKKRLYAFLNFPK